MRSHCLIAALLMCTTFVVFWQVREFEFLNFDDPIMVSGNPHVMNGLSWESVRRAFVESHGAMWLPLTTLSLMADADIYGGDAGGFHLTNLLWHAANVLLLYAAMCSLTGARWKSGFVAALFAVHPLHVESVAWISERKDVLSMFFGLLAILAYSRYARNKAVKWYALTFAAFCLSLMAKPLFVTLPCLLLLLDIWPLGRAPWPWPVDPAGGEALRFEDPPASPGKTRRPDPPGDISPAETSSPAETWRRLIVEKLPLLVPSIGASVVTYLAEEGGGALPSSSMYSVDVRLANAVVVYVLYVWKTFWPTRLSVFYPHPGDSIPLWAVAGCATLLVIVSAGLLLAGRRRPYLTVGWLWYLGTLVPMIGVVQVGHYRMADRFTYLPIVGLFIMVTWLLPSIVRPGTAGRTVLYAAAAAVLVALTWTARVQANRWQDSVTLLTHSIAVTGKNARLENNLGLALEQRNQLAEAKKHYERAIALDPDYVTARLNMGVLFYRLARFDEAIGQFTHVLKSDPHDAAAHHNIGSSLLALGRLEEALASFQRAAERDPQNAALRKDLGTTLSRMGRHAEASHQFEQAVTIDGGDAEAHALLAGSLARRGQSTGAVRHYEKSLAIDPSNAAVCYNFANLLADAGRFGEAIERYLDALRLNPRHAAAQANLGIVLYRIGQTDEAVRYLQKALQFNPRLEIARQYLELARQKSRTETDPPQD